MATELTVVSIDSHVAPPVEDYQPFLETAYLEPFGEFVTQTRSKFDELPGAGIPFAPLNVTPSEQSKEYWREVEENYISVSQYAEPKTRLETMDDEGVAVEVAFHGGFNREPTPFHFVELEGPFGAAIPASPQIATLRHAGARAYNRWLAEVWQAGDPARLLGVASVPIWDVAAAIDEVKHASGLGLRMVNLPAPKTGLLTYNREEYDPFWAACVEHGMTLHSHSGEGQMMPPDPGPGFYAMRLSDLAYTSRRHLQHMVFGGVFERFPDLKLTFTEQTGDWVGHAFEILDSVYLCPTQARETPHIRDLVRLPSEYLRSNIYIGMSCASRSEVAAAIDGGYADHMMWGRDYPHPEGTWPLSLASLRSTFAGFPDEHIRAILGETAIGFLGLDPAAVRGIAEQVGPTVEQVQTPLDQRPATWPLSLGFRTVGPYA